MNFHIIYFTSSLFLLQLFTMGSVYDELVTKVAINRYRLTKISAAIFFCFILFLEYVG